MNGNDENDSPRMFAIIARDAAVSIFCVDLVTVL